MSANGAKKGKIEDRHPGASGPVINPRLLDRTRGESMQYYKTSRTPVKKEDKRKR